MGNTLTIGKVAELSGVSVETIRYYQRRALLEEPVKPIGGFRQYPEESVKRILFIKRAQALGFTLEEIQDLLALDQRKACLETRALAAHKVDLITQRIADLSKMKRSLARLVRSCGAPAENVPCPIIHMLADDYPFARRQPG